MTTKKMILAAMFAAILGVLSQISVPLPFSPVPITGQTFGVFLTGGILGAAWGTTAMIVYLLLGLIGVPVFAQANAGLAAIAGPTGGYLLGFLAGVFTLGKFIDGTDESCSYYRYVIGMLLALIITYLIGTLQLSYILHLDFHQGLVLGVIPYIPLDIVKLLAAAWLSKAVRTNLIKAGLLQ